MAEWVFDPRRLHAMPVDDNAARLCLSGPDRPPGRLSAEEPATATVTPIARRLGSLGQHSGTRAEAERQPARAAAGASPGMASQVPAACRRVSRRLAVRAAAAPGRADGTAGGDEQPEQPARPARERPARKAASGRSRRSSVPSWDEIMLGNSRQPD
jgi:hypothetical protein